MFIVLGTFKDFSCFGVKIMLFAFLSSHMLASIVYYKTSEKYAFFLLKTEGNTHFGQTHRRVYPRISNDFFFHCYFLCRSQCLEFADTWILAWHRFIPSPSLWTIAEIRDPRFSQLFWPRGVQESSKKRSVPCISLILILTLLSLTPVLCAGQ